MISRIALMSFFWSLASLGSNACKAQEAFSLMVHGGAGEWKLGPEKEAQYHEILKALLEEGERKLRDGGRALDVVEWAVSKMEDSPYFNAGKGAVKNSEGDFELDASIMDGKNLKAGAIGAARTVKNPIFAARRVMEQTTHVLLTGNGADQFAESQGLEIVEPSYFDAAEKPENSPSPHGTVGAVAWDRCANLAAATSTGGLSGKKPGRLGDSPIIGAGTYAKNGVCAVSATGEGEFFIRLGVAKSICDRQEWKKESMAQAAENAIADVGKLGGTGGVIVLDAQGNLMAPFNTEEMVHGFVTQTGEIVTSFKKIQP